MSTALSSYDQIKATRKMRWWYEALADYMIAHPDHRQNDIAAHFNRSPGTISTIINTDAFKAYLRQRRNDYEASLDQEVRGKLMNVASKGLDFLLEGLEKKRDSIPINVLQDVVDKSLRNLGYGAEKSAPAVNVNVNASHNQNVPVAVSLEDLDAARAALRASQAPAPPVIEQTVVEVESNDDID